MTTPLLMLAGLHAATAVGLFIVRRVSPIAPPAGAGSEATGRVLPFDVLRSAPHIRTLALMVVLSTTGAAVVDYLLKSEAAAEAARADGSTSRALLQFFAVFYTALQLVTFIAQTGVGASLRRLGLGRTIAILPAGLGVSSSLALLFQAFPMFAIARGAESVLRGSFFRSGYELLFVPMDPDEKRRTKTFLDVTCDRAGDAVGALIVQLVLFTSVEFHRNELLAVAIALAAAGLYLARRLDTLYLGVVARRLVQHGERTPIVVGSETGWTVIEMPARTRDPHGRTHAGQAAADVADRRPAAEDPRRVALRRAAPRRPGARRARPSGHDADRAGRAAARVGRRRGRGAAGAGSARRGARRIVR